MAERNWTEEQKEAFSKTGCNLLVSAGAGSGKTAVLVERIIRHISQGDAPLDIDRLLVVTFTKAAAAQMRQRLSEALSSLAFERPHDKHIMRQLGLIPQSSITNLHAFCLDLVRQHFHRVGLDAGFRITQGMERALLKRETLEKYMERQYQEGNPYLPLLADAYGGPKDDSLLMEIILEMDDFSRSQPDPEGWIKKACAGFAADSLTDYPWSGFLLQEIKAQIAYCREQLMDAASLYGGSIPDSWLLQVDEEIKILSSAMDYSDALEKFLAAMASFDFIELPREKGDATEEKKEFKKLRDQAKKNWRSLLDRYCRRSPDALIADMQKLAPLMEALGELVIGYGKALAEEKRRRNLLDFDDMEHFCLQILEDETNGIAAELRHRFCEVLVDEYQDINGVQERILQLLTSGHNCFVVGDLKQSIYRFRMAEPTLFLDKFHRFGQKEGGERVDLNKNFRSTPAVIEAVNFLFRQLMSREVAEIEYNAELELKPGRDSQETGAAVELYLLAKKSSADESGEAENASEDSGGEEDAPEEELSVLQAEARFMASRILELRKEGYAFADMAVLLRSTQNREEVVAQEFSRMGIPAVANYQGAYLDAPEVMLVLSLLQVIDNPLQDIPLAAVLRSPIGGFSLDELVWLRLRQKGTLYQALQAAADSDKETGAHAALFLRQLENWRAKAKQKRVSQLILDIFNQTGIFYLSGALERGEERQANLKAFYNQALEYDKSSFCGLFRFLRLISQAKDKGFKSDSARLLGENEDVVRIMSIHRSKGLEFPVVLVGGLGSFFYNGDNRKDILWHKDFGLGVKVAERKSRIKYPTLSYEAVAARLRAESMAEEMRVLYVAFTRAQERLVISGHAGNLDKTLANWAKTAACDTRLPSRSLGGDRRPLDWLGRAIIRHPDAWELRRLAGISDELPCLPDGGSRWQIKIVYPGFTAKQVGSEPKLLTELQSGKRLPEGGFKEEAAAVLGFAYPHASVCNFPAKWTVTELRKMALEDEEYIPPELLADAFLRVSAPICSGAQKAALRGSANHWVLEHLDLSHCGGREEISMQIEKLAQSGRLPQEIAALVDIDRLADFFATPLGKRLCAAPKIYRELPFTYMISAAELRQGIDAGERLLLQGMIDVAFIEDDNWVILDYKTGGVGEDTNALIKRYAKQIEYYARALADISEKAVSEAYLYMIDDGRIISVPLTANKV